MPSVRLLCCSALLVASACDPAPVQWSPPRTAPPSADSTLVLQPDGRFTAASDSALVARVRVAMTGGPVCPGSVQVAASRGTLYAVWWAPRADSAARLVESRSSDGGQHWTPYIPIDTTDAGMSGCNRVPPAIAADSASGYVHVTYAMTAKEGPGIFFSHSMDAGASFHAPVPILYGEHLGRTSVAADGDLVVVAFEDPNSNIPRIGVAISHTMGHIFEDRIVPVSDDNGIASDPRIAVGGRQIAVAWKQQARENARSVTTVRAGTLR